MPDKVALTEEQREVMGMAKNLVEVGPSYLLTQKGELKSGPLKIQREVYYSLGWGADFIDVFYFGQKVCSLGNYHHSGDQIGPVEYTPGKWESRIKILHRQATTDSVENTETETGAKLH